MKYKCLDNFKKLPYKQKFGGSSGRTVLSFIRQIYHVMEAVVFGQGYRYSEEEESVRKVVCKHFKPDFMKFT